MGRDVPFKPDKKCDVCGHKGAFDYYGDYICPECNEASMSQVGNVPRDESE